ncbi:MAG: site-specific DNA-methyltransferase [Candidatus Omnitrophota bacterium]
MEICKIELSQINPTAYNPRIDLQPEDKDYQKLKRSIDTFGYVEPLVWNRRTGNLVGGHQRFKILKEQGLEEVEVSVVDLDADKEKALNLALNKIRGDWDDEKLAQLLQELTTTPDFDATLTGFDIPEISSILDTLVPSPEDGFNFEDALHGGPAITAPGDLILLGEHRLLCGDSTKRDDLERLLDGELAGLLHTDPPYNVDYSGDNRPIDDSSGDWRKIANDNMPQEKYEAWLAEVLQNAVAFLASGAAMYIWNGSRQFGPMYEILLKEGIHVSCIITWAKESFALGFSDYNHQTEFCFYGWKDQGGSHKWYGPNNESTLWQIKRDSTAEYVHPTQKPVALAHRAIVNSSKRGDVVLDLFLGSGTTLIAAESLKRRCYGMELDPLYCDAIVKRYIKFAGKERVSSEVLEKYKMNE